MLRLHATVELCLTCLLLVLLKNGPLHAATYHLAPDGNDGNVGTSDQPFHSLNMAWTVIQPGDLVYLHGGHYRFDRMQSLTGKSGTAEKPIRIWAYPNENPTITRGPEYVVKVGINHELIYLEGSHIRQHRSFSALEAATEGWPVAGKNILPIESRVTSRRRWNRRRVALSRKVARYRNA